MRIKDFWTTLVRRWYIALIALFLAIAGTFYIVQKVGPTYEAEGSVLVFPPVATVQRETELQTQGNPYLVLGGVSQARDIVIRALTSKATQEELANEYPDSSFEATPDFTNSAPIILITTKASSSDQAVAALAAVMDRVPSILVDLQSGLDLPTEAQITSRPLVADPSPDPVYSTQIRAGLVAGVAALGLGLLFVGLLDGLLAGRATKKRPKKQDDSKPPGPLGGGGSVPEPELRGPERKRRMAPRAPVPPKGDRVPMADDRQPPADPSPGRRLSTVSIQLDAPNGAGRPATA